MRRVIQSLPIFSVTGATIPHVERLKCTESPPSTLEETLWAGAFQRIVIALFIPRAEFSSRFASMYEIVDTPLNHCKIMTKVPFIP